MSITGTTIEFKGIEEPVVKKVDLEKLKKEIGKRSITKKTKDELISDLKDLKDLYVITYNELMDTRKKLRDVEGDLVIKNEVIEGNNVAIESYEDRISQLNTELEIRLRLQEKTDEFVDKLINPKIK